MPMLAKYVSRDAFVVVLTGTFVIQSGRLDRWIDGEGSHRDNGPTNNKIPLTTTRRVVIHP